MAENAQQVVKKPQPAHNLDLNYNTTTQQPQQPQEVLTLNNSTSQISSFQQADRFGRRQSLPGAQSNLPQNNGPNFNQNNAQSNAQNNAQNNPNGNLHPTNSQQQMDYHQQQQQQQLPPTASADQINSHPNNQITDYAKKIKEGFSTAIKAQEEVDHVRLKRLGITMEAYDPLPTGLSQTTKTPPGHVKLGPYLSVPEQHYYQHIFQRYNNNIIQFLTAITLFWVLFFIYDMIYLVPSLTDPVNGNSSHPQILVGLVATLRILGIITIFVSATIVILTSVYGNVHVANEKSAKVQLSNKESRLQLEKHPLPNLHDVALEPDTLYQYQQQLTHDVYHRASIARPSSKGSRGTIAHTIPQRVTAGNQQHVRNMLANIRIQNDMNSSNQISIGLSDDLHAKSHINLDINSHYSAIGISPRNLPLNNSNNSEFSFNFHGGDSNELKKKYQETNKTDQNDPINGANIPAAAAYGANHEDIMISPSPLLPQRQLQQDMIQPTVEKTSSINNSRTSGHRRTPSNGLILPHDLTTNDFNSQHSQPRSRGNSQARPSQQSNGNNNMIGHTPHDPTILSPSSANPRPSTKHRRTPSAMLYPDEDDARTTNIMQSLASIDVARQKSAEIAKAQQQPPLPPPSTLPIITPSQYGVFDEYGNDGMGYQFDNHYYTGENHQQQQQEGEEQDYFYTNNHSNNNNTQNDDEEDEYFSYQHTNNTGDNDNNPLPPPAPLPTSPPTPNSKNTKNSGNAKYALHGVSRSPTHSTRNLFNSANNPADVLLSNSIRFSQPPVYPSKTSQLISYLCCCVRPRASPSSADKVSTTVNQSPSGGYTNMVQQLIEYILRKRSLNEHVLITATNILILFHIIICFLYKSLDLVQNVVPIIFFSFLTMAFSHVHWNQLTLQTTIVAIVHIVLYILQIADVSIFNIPSVDAQHLTQIARPADDWDGILLLICIVFCYLYQMYTTQFIIRPETNLTFYLTHGLEQNEKTYFSIVKQLLPTTLIQKYKQNSNLSIWQRHTSVTIMFIYINKFDQIAAKKNAQELVVLLNNVFSSIDVLTHFYKTWGAYKIETVGEVYMISSGSPYEQPFHADVMCDLALDIVKSLSTLFKQLDVKIGINSGPIVAGIIGIHYPRYRVIGDTVNTSSRMSSTTKPGTIQLSSSTMRRICAPLQLLLWEYSEGLAVQDAKLTKAKLYKKLGELREKRQYYELTAQLEAQNQHPKAGKLVRRRARQKQQQTDIEMGILGSDGTNLVQQELEFGPNSLQIQSSHIPGKPILPPLHRIPGAAIIPVSSDTTFRAAGSTIGNIPSSINTMSSVPPAVAAAAGSVTGITSTGGEENYTGPEGHFVNRNKSNSVLVAGYNSNMSFSQKQLVSLLKEKMYKKHIEKYGHRLPFNANDSKHFQVLSLGIKEVKGKGKMSTWQLVGRVPGSVRRYEPCPQTTDHRDSDDDDDDDFIAVEPLEIEELPKHSRFEPNQFTAPTTHNDLFLLGSGGVAKNKPTKITLEEQQQPLDLIMIQPTAANPQGQYSRAGLGSASSSAHIGTASPQTSLAGVPFAQRMSSLPSSNSELTDDLFDETRMPQPAYSVHPGTNLQVKTTLSYLNDSASIILSPQTSSHRQLTGLQRLAKQVGYGETLDDNQKMGLTTHVHHSQQHLRAIQQGIRRGDGIGGDNNSNDNSLPGLQRASSVILEHPQQTQNNALPMNNNNTAVASPTPAASSQQLQTRQFHHRGTNLSLVPPDPSQIAKNPFMRRNSTSQNSQFNDMENLVTNNNTNNAALSHFGGAKSPGFTIHDADSMVPYNNSGTHATLPRGGLGGGKIHKYKGKHNNKGPRSLASGSVRGSDDEYSHMDDDEAGSIHSLHQNHANLALRHQIPANASTQSQVMQDVSFQHTTSSTTGNNSGVSAAPPLLLLGDDDGFVHDYKKPMHTNRSHHRHTVGPHSSNHFNFTSNAPFINELEMLGGSDAGSYASGTSAQEGGAGGGAGTLGEETTLERENSDDNLVGYWQQWASAAGAQIVNFDALVDDKRRLYSELKLSKLPKEEQDRIAAEKAAAAAAPVPLVNPKLSTIIATNQLKPTSSVSSTMVTPAGTAISNGPRVDSPQTLSLTSPAPAGIAFQAGSPLPESVLSPVPSSPVPPALAAHASTSNNVPLHPVKEEKKDVVVDIQDKQLERELQKLSSILGESLDTFLSKEKTHSDDELIDNATNVQSYYMRGNETTLFLYPPNSKSIISPFTLEFYSGRPQHRLKLSNIFCRTLSMHNFDSDDDIDDEDDAVIELSDADDDTAGDDDDDDENSGILCWRKLTSRELMLKRQKAKKAQRKKEKKIARKEQKRNEKKNVKHNRDGQTNDSGYDGSDITDDDDDDDDHVHNDDTQPINLDDNTRPEPSITWNEGPNDRAIMVSGRPNAISDAQRPQFNRGSVANTFAAATVRTQATANTNNDHPRPTGSAGSHQIQHQNHNNNANKKRFTVHLPKPLLQDDGTPTFVMSNAMVRTLETGYLEDTISFTKSTMWWLTLFLMVVFCVVILPYALSLQQQQAETITLSKLPAGQDSITYWRNLGALIVGAILFISWFFPLLFLRNLIYPRYFLKGSLVRPDPLNPKPPSPSVQRLFKLWDEITALGTPTFPQPTDPDEWVEGTGIWYRYFEELLRLFYFISLQQTTLKLTLDLDVTMYYIVLTSYFAMPHALLLLLWFVGIHTTTIGCIALYLTLFAISIYTFIPFKLTCLWTLTTFITTIVLTIVGTDESPTAKTWYLVMCGLFSILIIFESYMISLNRRIQYIQSLHLYHDHTQSLTLFEKLLPQEILSTLDRRGQGQGSLNTSSKHQFATVMFADVVNFTVMSAQLQSEELVLFLNMMFSVFDQLSSARGVYKVETIGDCYFACTNVVQSVRPFGVDPNVPLTPSDHAENMVYFAMDIIFYLSLLPHPLASKESRQVRTKVLRGIFRALHVKKGVKETWNVFLQNEQQQKANAFALAKVAARNKVANINPVMLRVGIHTGDVVAGVVGRTNPRYHIFGKTVSLSQKIESNGYPGRVSISATTRNFLPPQWRVWYKKTLILEKNTEGTAQHAAPQPSSTTKDIQPLHEQLRPQSTPRHNTHKTLNSGLVSTSREASTPSTACNTPSGLVVNTPTTVSSYHASAVRRKSLALLGTSGPDEGLTSLLPYPEEDEDVGGIMPKIIGNDTMDQKTNNNSTIDEDDDDGDDLDFIDMLRNGPDIKENKEKPTDNNSDDKNKDGLDGKNADKANNKPNKDESLEEAIRYMEIFMIHGHDNIQEDLWFPQDDLQIWPPQSKAKPNHRYF